MKDVKRTVTSNLDDKVTIDYNDTSSPCAFVEIEARPGCSRRTLTALLTMEQMIELRGAVDEAIMSMGEATKARLEELRVILRSESISYGELYELRGLAQHIEPGDVELLEAAGVPEGPGDDATMTDEAGNVYSVGAAVPIPAPGTDERRRLHQRAELPCNWDLHNADYYEVHVMGPDGFQVTNTDATHILHWPIERQGCVIEGGSCYWADGNSAADVLAAWFNGEEHSMGIADYALSDLARARRRFMPVCYQESISKLIAAGDLLQAFRELAVFWESENNDAGAAYCSRMIEQLLPE